MNVYWLINIIYSKTIIKEHKKGEWTLKEIILITGGGVLSVTTQDFQYDEHLLTKNEQKNPLKHKLQIVTFWLQNSMNLYIYAQNFFYLNSHAAF